MSVQILSDLDVWREVAHDVIPAEGDKPVMYEVKAEAYALVVVGSMSIGMGELNEKTAEEWLTRLRVGEAVFGPWLYGLNEAGEHVGLPVTMDMLRPYFGTRTNVFPKETAASFSRRMGKALFDETLRKVRRETAEAEAAEAEAAEAAETH